MKKNVFLPVLFVCMGVLNATPITLDGTASVVFETDSYPFNDGDSAVGAVRLESGFSIPDAGVVTMNIFFPLAGQIDLGGTGTLSLTGDLSLASNATIYDGGIIDGQGNTIFLNGNVTIPEGVSIACASDLVIDGQGHELVFEGGAPGGQLIIDGASGTTVTLRNTVVKGLTNYSTTERSIMFGTASDQKLVLENATCYLGGPMIFDGGALDIKGVSTIKGWHTLDYQAPYDLTVHQDSTLFIDMHTTLKYRPSDGLSTHVVLTDKTARLFLYGATLDVYPATGLRLTYGHVIVDHLTVFYGHGARREAGSIMFGDGDHDHDVYIDILPAASIDITRGFLTYNNSN